MKVGTNTSTVIHRKNLSKTDGKYKLNKNDKVLIEERNKLFREMKKYKTKCLNCRYLKDSKFCLRTEKQIENFKSLTNCKYFYKI